MEQQARDHGGEGRIVGENFTEMAAKSLTERLPDEVIALCYAFQAIMNIHPWA